MIANPFEHPEHITRKLTRAGLPNPRLRNAQAQKVLMFRKDLVGEFKTWKRTEIAKTYTPEYVESLLQRAKANVQNMTAPGLRPFYLPEE